MPPADGPKAGACPSPVDALRAAMAKFSHSHAELEQDRLAVAAALVQVQSDARAARDLDEGLNGVCATQLAMSNMAVNPAGQRKKRIKGVTYETLSMDRPPGMAKDPVAAMEVLTEAVPADAQPGGSMILTAASGARVQAVVPADGAAAKIRAAVPIDPRPEEPKGWSARWPHPDGLFAFGG